MCAAGKDPPQHHSPTTRIMSAEGEIKMKKSGSSGEVRRQQGFMRPGRMDQESERKRKTGFLRCKSAELSGSSN